MVMALSENHTNGTRPGSFTPVAMVANNDVAVGMIVDRISQSNIGRKSRSSSLKTTHIFNRLRKALQSIHAHR